MPDRISQKYKLTKRLIIEKYYYKIRRFLKNVILLEFAILNRRGDGAITRRRGGNERIFSLGAKKRNGHSPARSKVKKSQPQPGTDRSQGDAWSDRRFLFAPKSLGRPALPPPVPALFLATPYALSFLFLPFLFSLSRSSVKTGLGKLLRLLQSFRSLARKFLASSPPSQENALENGFKIKIGKKKKNRSERTNFKLPVSQSNYGNFQ